MSAVIQLVPVRRAAKTVESVGFGIGAQAEVLEICDAGARNAGGDIAGQVEHGVTGIGRGCEEARIVRIGGDKPRDEFRPDLVVRLPESAWGKKQEIIQKFLMV